ncbi:MAG: hypothetical protein ABIS92_16820 [Polyangia bacterium]
MISLTSAAVQRTALDHAGPVRVCLTVLAARVAPAVAGRTAGAGGSIGSNRKEVDFSGRTGFS